MCAGALLVQAAPASAGETAADRAPRPRREARAEGRPAPRDAGAPVLRLKSNWPETQLYEHLGSTFGQGYIGGRSASITTVYLRKVCDLPCAAPLRPDGDYFVDAPGMRARRLRLLSGEGAGEATVEGAPVWPIYLSVAGIAVGGSLTLLGSLLWISSARAGVFPVLTLLGLATLGAGIAGFVLAPSTEITSASGRKLTRRSPLRLGPEGLVF